MMTDKTKTRLTMYINIDALVAEIESSIRSLEACLRGEFPMAASVFLTEQCKGRLDAYKNVLSLINALEIKEVNLDCEVEKCLKQHSMLAVGKKDFTDIAKYFFELGMQQSNNDKNNEEKS